MRFAHLIVAALALIGCAQLALDSAALPLSAANDAVVWGMIVDASGVCIPGAVAVVTAGQSVGQARTQETPCEAWNLEGGFVLEKLSPAPEVTIQVSAPGYATLQRTVVPVQGWKGSKDVLEFKLAKQ